MKPVTVIIPVYNAFDVTLDCIRSVLATIPSQVEVCVIDDASPAGDLREFLPVEVLRHPQLRLLRNEKNLGFVGTCNRGMLLESRNDVILLNSDTVVTKRWVQKLQRAAYSRGRIGTVTPLTNNGTICSVPAFLENNTIPEGFSLEGFAQLVEDLSAREYVNAPTCVGFCTYIRREMLDEVGVFDPIFKQGYGEENDLSLRGALKGYSNIIDDATYIYHRGNMSFKEMRESLSKENTQILNARYSSYAESVASFCGQNPLGRVHDRIWNVLVPRWIDSRKRVVLHIAHNGPFVARYHGIGGTELHIQSLIRLERDSAHFSLTPGNGCLYLTAHSDLGDRTVVLPKYLLSAILRREFFDVIHLHHSLGFDLQELADCLCMHGNYIVSVHDYHLVCGRLWLFRPDNTACDGVSCGGSCGESLQAQDKRRLVTKNLLENAPRVLVFSESSKQLMVKILGDVPNLEVSSHGIDNSTPRNTVSIPAKPGINVPLKVVCVGSFTQHKGAELIAKAAVQLDSVDGVSVEWFFLGRGAEDVPRLSNKGEFTSATIGEKIFEIGAHVALLAPQCHETYSLTLDDLVWSGVPVICSPFGALPERVIDWGVGYVFDNSVEDLRRVLSSIVNRWEHHMALFRQTATAPIRSLEEEVQEYSCIYSSLVSPVSAVASQALMSFLQPDLCGYLGFNPGRVMRRVQRSMSDNLRKLLASSETAVSN